MIVKPDVLLGPTQMQDNYTCASTYHIASLEFTIKEYTLNFNQQFPDLIEYKFDLREKKCTYILIDLHKCVY